MTKFRKNNSGFSLVEVLVSLGIIGIIVVPLIGNFIASQNVNRTLRMRQAATALAQSTMETMKNMNMKDTAANFNVNDSFSLGGYSHGDVLELGHNGLNYVKLSNSYAGVV
ncbi:MAG: type II secretion system protein, partial [Lachnospiraceae bacterium]|nr:type II secretion system protein [Lachnospiraceae bacterium]